MAYTEKEYTDIEERFSITNPHDYLLHIKWIARSWNSEYGCKGSAMNKSDLRFINSRVKRLGKMLFKLQEEMAKINKEIKTHKENW